MKKTIIAIAILSISTVSFAQKNKKKIAKSEVNKTEETKVSSAVEATKDAVLDENYIATMKGLIMKMNAAKSTEAFDAAGNGFERIADAETMQWLPLYYAAYCKIMGSFMSEEKNETDKVLDDADLFLARASKISNNDEINCLQAMVYQARIGVDPMTRGASFGQMASESLALSSEMNPLNPRPDFLRGQSAFYTPEAFGGGKEIAKKYFQSAVDKFSKFKPSSDLMPNWGSEACQAMLEKCDK